MTEFKLGDRVRVKSQKDWPSPPGFRFANAEGTVVNWVEYEEVMAGFQDNIYVHIEKAQGEGKVYIGNDMNFRAEDLEKIGTGTAPKSVAGRQKTAKTAVKVKGAKAVTQVRNLDHLVHDLGA